MMDILSAFPSPCGDEQTLKKYIKTRLGGCKWEEDSIGNLIVRKGEGTDKWVIYCAIDEDAFVAMTVKENKVWFGHLGHKPVYPGDVVSFGGYRGVICAEDDEKPTEGQFIKMLEDCNIEVGMSGVLEAEVCDEETVIYTKAAAQRCAISALLELCEKEINAELTIIFGVQGNNGHKGAITADKTMELGKVLVLEQSDMETDELTLKVGADGYICDKKLAEEICEKCGTELKNEVNMKKQSAAGVFANSKAVAVGIPVMFGKNARQAVKKETVLKLKKFLFEMFAKEDAKNG